MSLKRPFPDWWDWQLDLTPHLLKRMEDRDFNELDLRQALHAASACKGDIVDGRWVIEARRSGRRWEVVVEADGSEQLLVIITAYPVSR